ncbi:MAG: PPE family protein [Mycolicibacterium cosmeticum]|nr:PPE family protein [Mycolicibacterium cosmeticum]
MFYEALPPEINTGRLMLGAGPTPMFQAAAAWETLAISLETQAEELAASLASLTGSWQGQASEQAVTATTPMVVWLRTAALQSQKRAMQAIAQANSYMLAMAVTPPLPEIAMNHVTNATLNATNFLGVNAVPIGINEADYVRMWEQAAAVMFGYQAETTANTIFEPILPAQPIVMPGIGEMALSMASGQLAATLPGSAMREAAFAHTTMQATLESAGLTVGRGAAFANQGEQRAQGAAQKADKQQGQMTEQLLQQGAQQGMQIASQLGQTLMQAPQQMTQGVTQTAQTLTSPLQQVSSIFGQMGGSGGRQFGLIGASPFSEHPLLGGSGATSGAGLVRAASLPGAGGTLARTPLMSSLVGSPTQSTPVPTGAAAAGSGTGLAPVGSGAGGGNGSPMHGAHQREKDGGKREALATPSPLAHGLDEDDDDW